MDKKKNPFNPFVWYGDIPDDMSSYDVSVIIHQIYTRIENYFENIRHSSDVTAIEYYGGEEEFQKAVHEFNEGLECNAEIIEKLIKWIVDNEKSILIRGIKELVNVIDDIVRFYQDECGFWELSVKDIDDDESLKHYMWVIDVNAKMCGIRSKLIESVKSLSLTFGQGDTWMIEDDEESESEEKDQPQQGSETATPSVGQESDLMNELAKITGKYDIFYMKVHRLYLALTGKLDKNGKTREKVVKDAVLDTDKCPEKRFLECVLNCDFWGLIADDSITSINDFAYCIERMFVAEHRKPYRKYIGVDEKRNEYREEFKRQFKSNTKRSTLSDIYDVLR